MGWPWKLAMPTKRVVSLKPRSRRIQHRSQPPNLKRVLSGWIVQMREERSKTISLEADDERILMPPFCITQADNCAPVNDEYYDREAGSIEGGKASVPSDVDSPATIAAVDNDASASAEPVQRVETCVENIEGAVEDDACVDDMDEEDSDEFFEAREVLEHSQDRTEASFSGTVDDAPAVEATVDDVTDDCEIGGGAAAEDPREAASSSDDDSTWFDARDRNPQTVTQPPHSLAPGNDHDRYCTKSAVKTEPRDNKAEFRAQLDELGVDGKTAALVFLANPTVRAVDPSPAVLTAEEERRLVSATCSASEWDDKVVPAPNAFLEQGRRYVSNCYAGCASGTRWPSGHDTVPAMRRRDLSPTVASRPKRPDASGEGSAYVAYSAFSTPTRHQAETDQASDKEPTVSEQYQRSLFDEQFGLARLTHPPLPGSAYNASLFSSATRVPSYSMGPKGSIAPSQAVTPGIDRKPTSSPRRSVGSGIGGRPARTPQANSPSVLRYRLRDLSPRRRARSSLCPSLGPAHEGLGSKPDAGDCRRVAKDDLVQNEMRQQGQQPSTNNSTVHFHGTAAMENSRKRDQAFMSDSEGAGTMKSRRMTVDGAEERALRVPAVSEATTEVGNILLSVVSGPGGEGDAIDLRRQAREEAQVVDIARDAFADAGNDGESSAEFVFPIDTKVRSKLTDEPARRRPQMLSFANVVPTKRSRPGRDTKGDGADHQSPVPADDVGGIDDESAGAFEFSGQRAPGRRVRQRVKVDGRAGNPSASSAPGAFLLSAPSASGLNQELGGRLFQSPGPARGGLGGLILGAGGGSVGNSAGFDEPLARSNLGRPPAPAPGTSGNPSGLFGSSKNSTQFGSGAGFWPPSAPQPQEFMFGSGPSPARAQGTSRSPSGLFGISKNSTQFDSGAGFWSPSAPQPQEFMFGPGPSPARAQGTSRNPSGLFGTSKNSTQFDSGAGFWSPSAPSLWSSCLGPVPRLLERTLHGLSLKRTPLARQPSNWLIG